MNPLAGLSLVLVLLGCGPRPAPQRAQADPTPTPRLAVFVVVDQFPMSLYEAVRPHLTGGLARLHDERSWVGTASHAHAAALTCPGHATLATASSPLVHGVIANDWVERGERRYCGDIGNLRADTLADRVKASGGRVASFSLKDRAALMLGGRNPDAIAWYDTTKGMWCERKPDWLSNDAIVGHLDQAWEAWKPELYDAHFPDDGPLEETRHAIGKTFPHPAPGAENPKELRMTPQAGTLLTDVAIDAIDELQLGADGTPDLLAISYSHIDYVGHAFTPRSWEALDAMLRLDEELGRLFTALDRAVGPDGWVVALSSDHGAANGSGHFVSVSGLKDRAREGMREAGLDGEPSFADGHIYLPTSEPGLRDAAIRAATDRLSTTEGVLHAWAWRLDGLPAEAPQREAIMLTLDPDRAGDIFVLLEEHAVFDFAGEGLGGNHGSPWPHDTTVPLLMRGQGLAPTRDGTADTREIAPTLAQWIHVPPPNDAEMGPIAGVFSD